MTIAVLDARKSPIAVLHVGENTAEAARQASLAAIDRTAAETAAAFAEEFSGPAYATQTAGELATTEGQFFRVPLGTVPETYTRYQRTAGGSVVAAPLATTSALASPDVDKGATLVRLQSGRTVEHKAGDVLSVKDKGATGDGTTDDTAAIQAALDTGAKWVVAPYSPTNYMISAPLVLSVGQTLVFDNGAAIQALASKTGTLNTAGNHFVMADDSAVIGATVAIAAGSYGLSVAVPAVFLLANVDRAKVIGCTADTTGNNIDFAVVSGTSDYCEIVDNYSTNGAIIYCYQGARYTLCHGNTVVDSWANAFTGSGNLTSRHSFGCVVTKNRAINPGRFGIEDWTGAGNTWLRGSLIEGNYVEGGASGTVWYGMSVVALDAKVRANTVRNWPAGIALETQTGHGNEIEGNHIYWDDGNPNAVIGIQIQNLAPAVFRPTLVTGNVVEMANVAINDRGIYGSEIVSNIITNPLSQGVKNDNANARSSIALNSFSISTQNTSGAIRALIIAGGVQSKVIGNHAEYETGANGAANGEHFIRVSGTGTIVEGNTAQGNSILAGGAAPVGFTSNGSTAPGTIFANNVFLGGVTASYATFTDLRTPGHNHIPGGTTSSGNAKLGLLNPNLWNAPTGTLLRGTVDGWAGLTAAAAYDQTQIQTLADELAEAKQQLAALVTDGL